jgi:hypothetical protein
MLDFFLAPILSLFSVKFYRRVLSFPRGLGFLYIAYLSLLLSTATAFLVRVQVLPVADEVVTWLGESLPQMVFTREGVRMEIKQPLLLNHPRWGPIFYFAPEDSFPEQGDLGKAAILVTRTHAAYRDPRKNQYRIQSLVPAPAQANWRDIAVSGPGVTLFWERLRPFLGGIIFLTTFVVLYLWKLLAGIFYSLIGLLLNLFRSERLPYGFILNLSFFALSPFALLQGISWLVPGFQIPRNVFLALAVTSLYLALGILATQKRREEPA